jgi:hypothetical protein
MIGVHSDAQGREKQIERVQHQDFLRKVQGVMKRREMKKNYFQLCESEYEMMQRKPKLTRFPLRKLALIFVLQFLLLMVFNAIANQA